MIIAGGHQLSVVSLAAGRTQLSAAHQVRQRVHCPFEMDSHEVREALSEHGLHHIVDGHSPPAHTALQACNVDVLFATKDSLLAMCTGTRPNRPARAARHHVQRSYFFRLLSAEELFVGQIHQLQPEDVGGKQIGIYLRRGTASHT